MRMSKLLTTFLACICLVFQASFRIAEAADGMIITGISFNLNTDKCCDSVDKSKCFTGAACCGSKQWTDGCFYSSNLCSTNECGTPAPSSSSAGVPAAVVPVVVSTSGGMMHFIHPVMVLGMGALLALLL